MAKRGGVRGGWYMLMNKIPGGLRAALFIALSLLFWYLIAKAAYFALKNIPTSFGGGGGADVTPSVPWLWSVLFLLIGIWVASITVWPAPPDPEIRIPYSASEEQRIRAQFEEADRLAYEQLEALRGVIDTASEHERKAEERVKELESRLVRAESEMASLASRLSPP